MQKKNLNEFKNKMKFLKLYICFYTLLLLMIIKTLQTLVLWVVILLMKNLEKFFDCYNENMTEVKYFLWYVIQNKVTPKRNCKWLIVI